MRVANKKIKSFLGTLYSGFTSLAATFTALSLFPSMNDCLNELTKTKPTISEQTNGALRVYWATVGGYLNKSLQNETEKKL